MPLDEILGVQKQSCTGGPCKSFRDFQLNCADARLRRGVRYLDADSTFNDTTRDSALWQLSAAAYAAPCAVG